MRLERIACGVFLGLAAAVNPALAQPMDCGSTGADETSALARQRLKGGLEPWAARF